MLLVGAAAFVCGGTDAVNAVSPAVASGSISLPRAARLAAAAELGGGLAATLFFPNLAEAVSHLTASVADTAAALLAVVVFASLAWRAGLPTSESHALVSALWGAAAATGNLSSGAWPRVILGLCLSLPVSAAAGYLAARLSKRAFRRREVGRLTPIGFLLLSGISHGVQDAQKFSGLLLAMPQTIPAAAARWIPPLLMALGTLLGGRRTVETVRAAAGGVSRTAAVGAECASGCLLLAGSALAFPLSTTQVKTAALIGAAKAGGARGDKSAAGRLLLAWGITFPAAAALGWLFRTLFGFLAEVF